MTATNMCSNFVGFRSSPPFQQVLKYVILWIHILYSVPCFASFIWYTNKVYSNWQYASIPYIVKTYVINRQTETSQNKAYISATNPHLQLHIAALMVVSADVPRAQKYVKIMKFDFQDDCSVSSHTTGVQ